MDALEDIASKKNSFLRGSEFEAGSKLRLVQRGLETLLFTRPGWPEGVAMLRGPLESIIPPFDNSDTFSKCETPKHKSKGSSLARDKKLRIDFSE